MNYQPLASTLLPHGCVATLEIEGCSILHFQDDMKGYGAPGHIPAAGDLQIVVGGDFRAGGGIKEILLHSSGILLPPIVFERRDVIKDEVRILSIQRRRVVRIH